MEFCYNVSDEKYKAKPVSEGDIYNCEQIYSFYEQGMANGYCGSNSFNCITSNSHFISQGQLRDNENVMISNLSSVKKNADIETNQPSFTDASAGIVTENSAIDKSMDALESQNPISLSWRNQEDSIKSTKDFNQPATTQNNSNNDSKSHIKRPMNAFMVWSQSERKVIAKEFPKMHNSDISKILGTRWKELSNEQKKPFIKMSKQLQHKHNIEHPNYKYKPRRKNKRGVKHNIHTSQFNVSGQFEKYIPSFNTYDHMQSSLNQIRTTLPNDLFMCNKNNGLCADGSLNSCIPNLSKINQIDPLNGFTNGSNIQVL